MLRDKMHDFIPRISVYLCKVFEPQVCRIARAQLRAKINRRITVATMPQNAVKSLNFRKDFPPIVKNES